jgi:hypothetical protein
MRNDLLAQAVSVLGGRITNMNSRNKLLADIVLASGGTVTDPNNRNQLLQDWLNAAGGGVLPGPTFDVDKIVTVSASIINQSTNESTVSFLEPYIENKYGKAISIVNESISGEDIADLRARCDALFDNYANEPNTRILLHYGGGDINPSSTFLNQGQSVQDAMIEDLNYVYDSAEQRGVKIMQAALTFRNYDGTTLKPTPAEQEAYALGSYTYTRDWIVPIMKQRTPELLDANDWPLIDFYNLTRNHVHEWLSPYDESDKVHPSDLGRIIISKYYVDSIIALSSGSPLDALPQRDFNVTYADATTPIDFVAAFGRDLAIDGNEEVTILTGYQEQDPQRQEQSRSLWMASKTLTVMNLTALKYTLGLMIRCVMATEIKQTRPITQQVY